MTPKITLEGHDAVIKGIETMARFAPSEMEWALQEATLEAQKEMKDNAPKVTGGLAGSINYSIDRNQLVAEIGPDDSYYEGRPVGKTVEAGRAAGRTAPPAFALMMRYGLSIAAAKKAAKTIADRGTQGKFFVLQTFNSIQQLTAEKGLEAIYRLTKAF